MALATFIAYLVVGAVVAFLLLAQHTAPLGLRFARGLLHALLWPLFAPLLFPSEARASDGAHYAARIAAAQSALESALRSLERELGESLSIESQRVLALGRAMHMAASRLEEIDGVLESPWATPSALDAEAKRLEGLPDMSAAAEILRERVGHVERLAAVRRQAQADLERAIARATELAGRLTLLRYEDPHRSGIAAERARDLTNCVAELCRTLEEVRCA